METVELVFVVWAELVVAVVVELEKTPKERDFELAETAPVLVEFLEALRQSTGEVRFRNSALVRLWLRFRS